MDYITKTAVQVWANVYPIRFGKRDVIGGGVIVHGVTSKGSYLFIDAPVKGWVSLALLRQLKTEPDPLTPAESGDIWLTLRGDRKPINYKPEGTNYGSFDIFWLMETTKISKPPSIRLAQKVMDYILELNDGDSGKVNWLVAQESTQKVLTINSNGMYSCPVPCGSGNNKVKALEVRNNYARIETVNVNKPLPESLPDYLVHTWWGFTKGGEYFVPLAGIGGVRYPLLYNADSAWIQLAVLAGRV